MPVTPDAPKLIGSAKSTERIHTDEFFRPGPRARFGPPAATAKIYTYGLPIRVIGIVAWIAAGVGAVLLVLTFVMCWYSCRFHQELFLMLAYPIPAAVVVALLAAVLVGGGWCIPASRRRTDPSASRRASCCQSLLVVAWLWWWD